jgi:hypothetical protein
MITQDAPPANRDGHPVAGSTPPRPAGTTKRLSPSPGWRRTWTRVSATTPPTRPLFNGGHTIHSRGTFDVLRRHLHWPKPTGGS